MDGADLAHFSRNWRISGRMAQPSQLIRELKRYLAMAPINSVILDQLLDGSRHFFIAIGANVRESIYFVTMSAFAGVWSRGLRLPAGKIQGAILHALSPGYERRTDSAILQ